MKCPMCNGEGGWSEDMGEGTILFEKCPFCKDGKITLRKWLGHYVWDYLSGLDWFIGLLDWFYERNGG